MLYINKQKIQQVAIDYSGHITPRLSHLAHYYCHEPYVHGTEYLYDLLISRVRKTNEQGPAGSGIALRIQHSLTPKEENDFTITNQAQILNKAKGITGIMTALLAGIAGISLAVGGIGIMNIMLVSVTERTREIGIRKAIGANRKVILAQFLTESVMLSLLGGLLGILLGVGSAVLIGSVSPLPTAITVAPVVYSFFFAMMVGVVFGVYPARKAASLNPIDALRYE